MGVAVIMALALSLDGFGVGMAYGLKKIKIPMNSMCIIAFCTALAMGMSMLLGHLFLAELTFISPKVLGAGVLIAIGSYQLIQAVKVPKEKVIPAMASVAVDSDSYKTLMSIKLNVFGLVIQVLKTPDAADMDRSGTISAGESILLGVALALDTFAAGMAATMTGISYYIIGLVAVMQIMMICAGQGLTGKLPSPVLEKVKFLPGVVLILIGFVKMV